MNNKPSMKPSRTVKVSWTPTLMLKKKNMMKRERKLKKSVTQSSRSQLTLKEPVKMKKKISMMNSDFITFCLFFINNC